MVRASRSNAALGTRVALWQNYSFVFSTKLNLGHMAPSDPRLVSHPSCGHNGVVIHGMALVLISTVVPWIIAGSRPGARDAIYLCSAWVSLPSVSSSVITHGVADCPQALAVICWPWKQEESYFPSSRRGCILFVRNVVFHAGVEYV